MTDEAYMQYVHEDTGTVARWYGGEYIELGYVATQDTGPFNEQGHPSYVAGDFVAHDVINVWDHANNKPRIDFHLDEFAECVLSHLKSDDDEEEDDETLDENGVPYPFGRCDTCGKPCDADGCTADRSHEIALDE